MTPVRQGRRPVDAEFDTLSAGLDAMLPEPSARDSRS